MKKNQVEDLLLQAVEHERACVLVYQAASKCAVSRTLASQLKTFLTQTRRHVEILEALCRRLRVDAERMTPMRSVVRHMGEGLLETLQMARANGDPNEAQLVACECVVVMEVKDHAYWQLLVACAEEMEGNLGQSVGDTCRGVLAQEDEHVSVMRGWQKELWIRQLGVPAPLPPHAPPPSVQPRLSAPPPTQTRRRATPRPG